MNAEDAFYITFKQAKELRERVAELETALREIARPTYGTELTDTDSERADTFWGHIARFQSIARKVLPNWAEKPTDSTPSPSPSAKPPA
jgi:hypothetical protein